MKKFPMGHQRATQSRGWRNRRTYDEADRTFGEIERALHKADDRVQCALKQIEDGNEDSSDDVKDGA